MYILARRFPIVLIAASIRSRSEIFTYICVCTHIYNYICIYIHNTYMYISARRFPIILIAASMRSRFGIFLRTHLFESTCFQKPAHPSIHHRKTTIHLSFENFYIESLEIRHTSRIYQWQRMPAKSVWLHFPMTETEFLKRQLTTQYLL